MGGGDDKKDKAGPAPSASAAPDTAAPPPAGPGPNTDQQLKPLIAGWQPQANATNHIAYDVPPAAQHWKLGTGSSYVDAAGKPVVAGEGEATYREGGCASADNPNAFGTAGKGQLATAITQGGQGDLGTNAVNVAGNWAFAAYGGKAHKPKISMGTPVPWKHNGIDGYIATAKVTVTYRPSACVPPTAVSRGLAYKGKDGQVHCWVLFADQGVPDALPMADIDKITSTVRPYPAG
nr:hypothetical protein [Streptomyces sp. SID5468]